MASRAPGLHRTAGSWPMVSRSSSRTFLTNRSRSERVRASETRLLVEAHRRDPLAVPSPEDAAGRTAASVDAARAASPRVSEAMAEERPGGRGTGGRRRAHQAPPCQTAIAFVCFCLAASGTYFLNDAIDVEADRQASQEALTAGRRGRGRRHTAIVGGDRARSSPSCCRSPRAGSSRSSSAATSC